MKLREKILKNLLNFLVEIIFFIKKIIIVIIKLNIESLLKKYVYF